MPVFLTFAFLIAPSLLEILKKDESQADLFNELFAEVRALINEYVDDWLSSVVLSDEIEKRSVETYRNAPMSTSS